jgi:short-subunit dehydrogenase
VELKSIHSPVRVQPLCPGITDFQYTERMRQSGIPRSLWTSTEEVVNTSLRGLERNKLIVIPGWRYRVLFYSLRPPPRSLKHRIAIKYAGLLNKGRAARKAIPTANSHPGR